MSATQHSQSTEPSQAQPGGVDPRGLRFAAAVTTVVLAAALLFDSAWVLAFQSVVFALAASLGVRRSPYGVLFAKAVRPQLAKPAELEDPTPPRFAQAVGLAFSLIGLLGYAVGVEPIAVVAIAFALAAAFLNAAFGLCLGCEAYLMIVKIFPARRREGTTTMEVSA